MGRLVPLLVLITWLGSCKPVAQSPFPLEAHIKCAELGLDYYQAVCTGQSHATRGDAFQGCGEPTFEVQEMPDTGPVPHRAACFAKFKLFYSAAGADRSAEHAVKIFDVP